MKKLYTLALLLAALLVGITVGALVNQYIISPTVTVTVEPYTLTLQVDATTCVIGDTLNFSGVLSSNSFLFQDVNVTLYCDDAYTGFWDLTDENGYYEILYPTDTAGTFDFHANATITA